MAAPATFDDIMRQANDLGYKITLNKTTGKPHMQWPAKRNPAFEQFVKQNKAVLESGFKTPQIVKDRVKDAGNESWVAHVNHKINEYRDRFVTPGVRAAGGFVGRHSWLADLPGINTPEDATKLGGGIAEYGEKALIPDTATGKGINAALALTGGESAEAEEGLGALRGALSTTRGRVLAPALVGGVTGGLSGEGTVPGVVQGLVAGGIGEAPRIPGEIGAGRDYLKRAEIQYRKDDIVPGERLSPVLRLKSFDDLRKQYGNWVMALRDGRVSREAGQRFAGGMQDLTDAINSYALSKAKQLREDFMNKMKVPFSKTGHDYSPEMYKEYQAVKDEIKKTLSDAKQLTGAMRTMKRLRAESFDNLGRPKGTPSAVDSQKTYELTKGAIKDKLASYNPAFKGTYDALNEEYAMFGGLRQIADNKKAIMDVSGHVDLDAINHELVDNPRRYQSRIGQDNWDSVRQLFRRQASDAPNYEAGETRFDQPGFGGRIRTMMYGTRGHAAASADVIGDALSGAPLVTKPVGLPKRQPVVPGQIPRLITGGAVNEGEEKIRDAVTSGQQ